MNRTKRICLACDLKDEPELIAAYERYHQPDNAWPEVTRSIRDAGILEMEIYRVADRLFMIMEVDESFDPTAKRAADAANPKVQEWEALMLKFQQPPPFAKDGDKWVEMECIYRLSSANT